MRFRDRLEAAKLLAEKLEKYKGADAVVYALPRGGVVLGKDIAEHLGAPLDLVIPRKIGHPHYPEYAVCAVTEDGHLICNQQELARLDPQWLKLAVEKEKQEANRRRQVYMAGKPPVPAQGKVAIIVDDGVATGLTMQAAIEEVKARVPDKIVLAVPVMPSEVAEQLKKQVDEVVALDTADPYLGAVGSYYRTFEQVEDDEVLRLLQNSINTTKGADAPAKATKKAVESHG